MDSPRLMGLGFRRLGRGVIVLQQAALAGPRIPVTAAIITAADVIGPRMNASVPIAPLG